jgi:hypothetical protein
VNDSVDSRLPRHKKIARVMIIFLFPLGEEEENCHNSCIIVDTVLNLDN